MKSKSPRRVNWKHIRNMALTALILIPVINASLSILWLIEKGTISLLDFWIYSTAVLMGLAAAIVIVDPESRVLEHSTRPPFSFVGKLRVQSPFFTFCIRQFAYGSLIFSVTVGALAFIVFLIVLIVSVPLGDTSSILREMVVPNWSVATTDLVAGVLTLALAVGSMSVLFGLISVRSIVRLRNRTMAEFLALSWNDQIDMIIEHQATH